ncbi:helix-turn-helix domain-containing protein [Bythopirellula polymerisocia]|uniref:Helix-turn-helix domain protein n=1 Tax=Bythopirellula polymerisocia TaxID=2528003 RepID=A0A5C6CY48_9BACT|nr:helix-turn-helix domain-containing protein [Bythopirellula polymerisocia]TWU28411.1 Helix-turn-helix domain protein [Bythopirellula polymerisocia]
MMDIQSVESLALRPREAAKALSISARTLWGQTAPRGPIPCLRIGHGKRQSVLYPVAELQAWLSQQAEAESQQVEAEEGGDNDAC